jgi:hypothetical protein
MSPIIKQRKTNTGGFARANSANRGQRIRNKITMERIRLYQQRSATCNGQLPMQIYHGYPAFYPVVYARATRRYAATKNSVGIFIAEDARRTFYRSTPIGRFGCELPLNSFTDKPWMASWKFDG